MLLLLRDRRQEDDRNRACLCALLDQSCRFEPVETRHLRIEQDHGDLLCEETAKRLLTRVREDEVFSERLEDRSQCDEVLHAVVDEQDVHPVGHAFVTAPTQSP